jgi:hypothetical protein
MPNLYFDFEAGRPQLPAFVISAQRAAAGSGQARERQRAISFKRPRTQSCCRAQQQDMHCAGKRLDS